MNVKTPLKHAKPRYHLNRRDYLFTPKNDPRGYIMPDRLRELWFHTGTACNLSCPFCLEGSKPGENRIQYIRFEEAKELIDEALPFAVERFSFTGGEPFVNPDMIKILEYALERRPCLVLTNATAPTRKRLTDIKNLKNKPFPLAFRVSLDYPDPKRHDVGRGEGNFQKAIDTMSELWRMGFPLAVARQETDGENREAVNRAYRPIFKSAGLPENLPMVVFPDLLPPASQKTVPMITEGCMTQFQTEESRSAFMCAFSRMAVKKEGRVGIYACTLVDDDADYDLGPTLKEAMAVSVKLKHHRCYSCFAYGTSCSQE